jgi:hypothetical protein
MPWYNGEMTGLDDDARLDRIAASLFFIVGCGRSGTTLVQSVLLSHPNVVIPPETKFASKFPAQTPHLRDLTSDAAFDRALNLTVAYERPKGVPFNEARFRELARAAPRSWDGILLALLAAVAEHEGRPRVGEKSTDHTRCVGRLSESFPRARFVHLLRDPRAVMLSRIRAGFSSGRLGTEVPRWLEAVRLHREHADRLGPQRYHLLRYESLVTDFQQNVEAICRFLDLDMRPEMLAPHQRASTGFTDRSRAWMTNTLRPVFRDSVDKWRTELTPTQIAMIEHALGPEMREMGYEPSGARTAAPRARLAVSAAFGHVEYARRKALRGLRKVRARSAPANPTG